MLLSTDIHDYPFVSQGKTEIPNVDDGEEFRMTDVSTEEKNDHHHLAHYLFMIFNHESISLVHFTCPFPIEKNNFWP